MNKIILYLLSSIFTINTIYHIHIRYRCIFAAKLTKGMTGVLIIIPVVFLSLAYSVGNGLAENVVLAVTVSLSIISQVVGRGISEAGIYYWTNNGINRLAKWEEIEKIDFDYSKSHLEKIRFTSYACYPDQHYHSKDIKEIQEYIKRRI